VSASETASPPAAGHAPRESAGRSKVWTTVASALRRPYAPDVAMCLFFVAVGLWLTHGLWPSPTTRVLALNPEDQTLVEWFLAYDSRILLGDFSLISHRLNAPDGINMLTNATTMTLGFLLAPVTLLFGAPTSFAVAVGGNLAATAIGWYFLYSRGLGFGRTASAVGAFFCGFAPAMLSQSNSHLHMTAQWLVPPIVWYVIRMARAADPTKPDHRKVITSAVALAALVTVQVFLGEEVLFLTAVTLALFTIGYALAQPKKAWRLAPRFAGGMVLAVGLATVVLAYPLSVQFGGPQSVPNGPFSAAYFSTDVASFPAFSPLSVAGTDPLPLPGSGARPQLTTGAAEYNTFLGWPLLLVVLGCVVWLRRHPMMWACVLAGAVMAWLSLGPTIVVNGERTGQRGLYSLIEGLPVIDGALPLRFAVALVPLIATLLALALDRAAREGVGSAWLVVPVAVGAALVPIAPKPLPTVERAPVPQFISQGHWRDCVEPGGVLVPVPLPTPLRPEAMRWATATNASFGVPEGFFIAPYGRARKPGGRPTASIGTFSQPTSRLLADVSRTGELPGIGPFQQAQARKDLAFWDASCVVLVLGVANEGQLLIALEALLGPAERVADAWIWKIRPAG